MMAIRSRFVPDIIEVRQGDEITIHVTNVEQSHRHDPRPRHRRARHERRDRPGRDQDGAASRPNKPGVYPFYCTNFCSALHQEMQGYLAVKP